MKTITMLLFLTATAAFAGDTQNFLYEIPDLNNDPTCDKNAYETEVYNAKARERWAELQAWKTETEAWGKAAQAEAQADLSEARKRRVERRMPDNLKNHNGIGGSF